MKVAGGYLYDLFICQSLDQLWLPAIICMPQAKLPIHVEPPCVNEPIKRHRHRMLPSARHRLNLDLVEYATDKPGSAHLVLGFFIQFAFGDLAKLAKAVSTPTVEYLIVVESQTVIVAAFDVG